MPADAKPRTENSNAMDAQQELTEEEYILAQEERELQALVAAMEEQERNGDNTSQHFGSDDDEYDQLFRECLAGEDAPQPSLNTPFTDPDAMDTS